MCVDWIFPEDKAMFGNKATTLSYLKQHLLDDFAPYDIPGIYFFSFEEFVILNEFIFVVFFIIWQPIYPLIFIV